MRYYSLNNCDIIASFEQAIRQGLAPDKGLFFPESITPLSKDFFKNIEYFTNEEIAFHTIQQFVGNEIPETHLKDIIADVLSFDFPLVKLDDNKYILELFHGPTLAFKDVGARFMSRCLGYFSKYNQKHTTVLVATSGDTGSAVANGFYDTNLIDVVILYPKGKVSHVQEMQLTTLGKNIKALEVNGTFDDCQTMVKRAFLDEDLKEVSLTSANSINVARWLPQMWYYFFAYKKIKQKDKKLVVSVPSGNFGNICAGMVGQKLGLPIHHFIASTNANDVVPRYLNTKTYVPKPSVQTISNAMDVGNPSNFIRIQQLYNKNYDELKLNLSSFSFNDDLTKQAIKKVKDQFNYIPDPHGAVGILGLETYQRHNPDTIGICLETAHPIKFLDVVEPVIGEKLVIPDNISSILNKQKDTTEISTYNELKNYLVMNPVP